MGVRNGRQFIDSLRDERVVYAAGSTYGIEGTDAAREGAERIDAEAEPDEGQHEIEDEEREEWHQPQNQEETQAVLGEAALDPLQPGPGAPAHPAGPGDVGAATLPSSFA